MSEPHSPQSPEMGETEAGAIRNVLHRLLRLTVRTAVLGMPAGRPKKNRPKRVRSAE